MRASACADSSFSGSTERSHEPLEDDADLPSAEFLAHCGVDMTFPSSSEPKQDVSERKQEACQYADDDDAPSAAFLAQFGVVMTFPPKLPACAQLSSCGCFFARASSQYAVSGARGHHLAFMITKMMPSLLAHSQPEAAVG